MCVHSFSSLLKTSPHVYQFSSSLSIGLHACTQFNVRMCHDPFVFLRIVTDNA